MRFLIISFAVLALGSCRGVTQKDEHISLIIESSFGECMGTSCELLEGYEEEAIFFDLLMPKSSIDQNSDQNVGEYNLDGSSFGLDIYNSEKTVTSRPENIRLDVHFCELETCEFKEDMLIVSFSDENFDYVLIFNGTKDVQLTSDGIPSVSKILSMEVSLQIISLDGLTYVDNSDQSTEVYQAD